MNSKICSLKMQNFGAVPSFSCDNLSNINLIIGENGTGKTILLKALYSAVRSMEEYHRGDDVKSIIDILADKLRWTFQVEKLGDIVSKSSKDNLNVEICFFDDKIGYQFTQSATTKFSTVIAPQKRRECNSIFLPAKEVLSLYSVILKSREVDKSFGFDDTYYDLTKALRISPSRGKNYTEFSNARKQLRDVVNGKVDFDETTGKWYYKNSENQKFSIGATSEGIKKISIMDRLLANGYLDNHSIVFIDEIESALHPTAICQFLDMISALADKMDMQFFISSHSYFVIKKLRLIAMKKENFVKCISLNKNSEVYTCDLYDRMPDNSIIDTSVKLFDEEIEGGL